MEHLDMLYRIARRLTREPAAAEDLVQETLLRAFRARESFDLQVFGIRPWLLRIMHNLNVSQSQRERRQPMTMEETQLDAKPGQANAAAPETAFGFDGMDQRLVQAIGDLPPDYQTVLLLWAVDELSYKEIAQACDIPIGTVMSRLHRARQRLMERLRGYAMHEGLIGRSGGIEPGK